MPSDRPQPRITTGVTPSAISAGQRSRVVVTIDGDSRPQTVRLSLAAVLVLDFSGSMGGDPADRLRAAAIQFINTLMPGDRCAIVAFSDDARVSGPLTDDFDSLRRFIGELDADGGTNYVVAISEANRLLRSSGPDLRRVALFFSDGRPSTNQGGQIYALVKDLSLELISYHTVGMGDIDETILLLMANATGGTYHLAASPDDLQRIFTDIARVDFNTLPVTNVRVREKLNPGLRFWRGSLRVSALPQSNNFNEFIQAVAALENNFENTGSITFPYVNYLPSGLLFSYSYEVIADTCQPNPQSLPIRSAINSFVEYYNGGIGTETMSFPVARLIVRECGVALEKEWTERSRQVHLNLVNSYAQGVRSLSVSDSFSRFFKIDPQSVAAPGTIDRTTNSVQWFVGDLEDKGHVEFILKLVDTWPLQPQGAYPIQADDFLCRWIVDIPVLEIPEADPDVLQLRNDIAAGRASAQIMARLRAAVANLGIQIPPSARVNPTTPDLAARGFTHVVDFTDQIPNGQPVAGSGFDKATGRFLLATTNTPGVLFSMEQSSARRFEMLTTSHEYTPGR